MKRRLQDISSEKVIAELAGTSFMTETGKVIEGNYQVGDIAPVVFDRSSKRYLAVWKTHRDEPVKAQPLRDEAPPTSLIVINKFVLAKFVQSEWNIYFTVLGEDPLTSTKHYYVDLADVVMEFFNAGLNLYNIIPFALRILEDRPDLGILFAFYGSSEVNFTSGMVIKFKVGNPVVPDAVVTYGGYVYHQREFQYVLVDFGTLEEDLDGVLPDFDIRAGSDKALGETTDYVFFPGDTTYFTPNPLMAPRTINETAPYALYGKCGWDWSYSKDYSPPIQGHTDFTYERSAAINTQKLGIAKLYDFSPKYQDPNTKSVVMGKELVPIGAMIWCEDDDFNHLKWEIQFSAREEYLVDIVTVSTSTLSTSGFPPEVTISSPVHDPYHVHIPLLLKRDETRWRVEDYQDIIGKPLCIETRGWFVTPFGGGYSNRRCVLFKSDESGVVQELTTSSYIPGNPEYPTTVTQRWFLPSHVAGRYRKAWSIPSGGTKTKPKLLLDFTTVDYTLWRQNWSWDQGQVNALIDQFVVRTFLALDGTIRELPNAATSEDRWSYRVSLGGIDYIPISYAYVDCIDYHSIPPVRLLPYLSPGVYYVPPYNFIPGDLEAKPDRTPYRHAGGGSVGSSAGGLVMCRTCPVHSQTSNRSVYILGSQVYDYDQAVPKIVQQDRHSRHLLTWLFPPGTLPSVDSTINIEGDAVVTLKHLTDYTKNIQANDVSPKSMWSGSVAFLDGGFDLCDVAVEIKLTKK